MSDCSASLTLGCTDWIRTLSLSCCSTEEQVILPPDDLLTHSRHQKLFGSWHSWLWLTKPLVRWPFHRSFRWSCAWFRILSSHVQNSSFGWGSVLLSEVSPGQQCTDNPRVLSKQLVSQLAQLLHVEDSANVGGELPTESRAPAKSKRARGGG